MLVWKSVNVFRNVLHKSEFGNHLLLVNRSFFLFLFLRSLPSVLLLLKCIIRWMFGFTASTCTLIYTDSPCYSSWHVHVSNQLMAFVCSRTFLGVRHSMSYWPGCFFFLFQSLLFSWWIAHLMSRKNKAININNSANELWRMKGYSRLTILHVRGLWYNDDDD